MVTSNYVILDLETGGLKPDKNPITEIGFIALDREFKEIIRYSQLIKPYDSNLVYEPEALQYNGTTMKDLLDNGRDCKLIKREIIKIFKDLKGKGKRGKPILIGHNIDFDRGFLAAFDPTILDLFDPIYQDTLQLCGELFEGKLTKENDSMRLGECCKRLGIELNNAHTALGDVEATVQLYINIVKRIRMDTAVEVKREVNPQRNFFQL